ncbi:MAG: ECF-type sigma factor [Planctomycetota bacterium]|nr:ECF-type sigma factor [Planctomycetota bacterium]
MDQPRQDKSRQHEVTECLQRLQGGDAGASDELLSAVYAELRSIAAAMMMREGGSRTLQPTALVHEAFVRLVGPTQATWENRAHFFGAAAQAMRRVLIDRARQSRTRREVRGAQSIDDDVLAATDSRAVTPGRATSAEELLKLDNVLETLRSRDERQHEVVMLRFFAGLTVEQTAEVMNLSPATVKNEWAYARAWLLRELNEASGGG